MAAVVSIRITIHPGVGHLSGLHQKLPTSSGKQAAEDAAKDLLPQIDTKTENSYPFGCEWNAEGVLLLEKCHSVTVLTQWADSRSFQSCQTASPRHPRDCQRWPMIWVWSGAFHLWETQWSCRKATPLAEVLGLSSAVLLLHITDISGNSTTVLTFPCPAVRIPVHPSRQFSCIKRIGILSMVTHV